MNRNRKNWVCDPTWKRQREKRERRKRRIEAGEDSSSSESEAEKENQEEAENKDNVSCLKEDKKDISKEPKFKKPKVDIWQKVTIGQKFEDAVERYLLRKANRPSQWPFER